jgi:signal transduction histidine kinase/GAF domain-containing protein
MSPTTPSSSLARALARGTRPADLLPELHRELLHAVEATRSVVLEASGTGDYVATSGRGLAALDMVWIRGADARDFSKLASDGPAVITLASESPLVSRLETRRALVIPVRPAPKQITIIVARPEVPEAEALKTAARAAVEFGIVLEWSRLAREGSFQHRMRELSLVFGRGVTSAASLGPALEIVAHEANALLGTRRLSVWLHDRRARELVLTASSDPQLESFPRLAVDSGEAAARGLRFERPQLVGDGVDRLLVAPLRVWRRALGTLIIEGGAPGIDDEQLLDLAHDLARQLAAGIENVQLLDEIVRQRRLLEDTFNSLVDLVVVTDRALRVVQVNEACVERVGRERAEIVGTHLADILGDAVASWVLEPGPDQGSEGGTPPAAREAIVRSHTFDTPRLEGRFSVTITPLVNEEEQTVGSVLVARDITVQSRLEADREALRARLVQSEKLAALGQFVAGIAHEMNNPLQGIMGHLELLIDHSEAAIPVRQELRRIYRESTRASRIVRNLLVFTGSRRMTRRKLRIDRVISRALASRRVALERAGIHVVRRSSEGVPSILGDPLLLQQALLNLLINAEHAIKTRGDGGSIELTIDARDDQAIVTVHDSGTGIPTDVLPRVFEPFFTTKEVGKGTGLGLAITYGIVQEHGGTISAENAADGGALFTITLPLAR